MKKKIIVASDSFKGSLSSLEVGKAIKRAVMNEWPEIDCEIIPVADGGEGTVDALTEALHGEIKETTVTGPMGDRIKANYGLSGETAIIEIAAASGLTLVAPEKRNPLLTSTFGTGEVIADAIKRGCRNFLIGLGGSATNDGGIGMLKALGARFYDKTGREIGEGGGEMERISDVDFSGMLPELKECKFKVACDVKNPLTGEDGASYVFGGQKGADEAMIRKLDEGMKNFARVTTEKFGKDRSMYPGAGAAGGLGYAFLSYMNATLMPGIEMVLDAVKFEDSIDNAMLVITGEGRLDRQTCMGKTPYGILKRASKKKVPVIAIGGSIDPLSVEQLNNAGFLAIFPTVTSAISLAEAMKPDVASANITLIMRQVLKILKLKE